MSNASNNPGYILIILFVLISAAFSLISWIILPNLPIDQSGATFVVAITIIFAFFVITPILLDIIGAYAFEYYRSENPDKLDKESKQMELTGVKNLTRAMVALSIILIIGVAIGL